MSERDDDNEAEAAAFFAKINQALLRDDVQEFMQVYNLGNVEVGTVTVSFRLLGPDFLARCFVRRNGAKRPRKLLAESGTRSGALQALAGVVADYLYPAVPKKGKKR